MDRHVADAGTAGRSAPSGQRGPGSPQTCITSSPSPTGPLDTCSRPKSRSGSCRHTPIAKKDLSYRNSDPLGCKAAVFTGHQQGPTGSSKNSVARWSSTTAPLVGYQHAFGGAGGRRTAGAMGKHTLLGMTDLRRAIQLQAL